MSTRHRRITRTLNNQLVEQLTQGERSPSELAGEHDMTLHQLASWAMQPTTLTALEGLAHLAEVRAQMLLSRYRANAAIQLIAIATADEPTELSRKACVDLLKADMQVFPGRDADDHAVQQQVNEREILSALEALGRESRDG